MICAPFPRGGVVGLHRQPLSWTAGLMWQMAVLSGWNIMSPYFQLLCTISFPPSYLPATAIGRSLLNVGNLDVAQIVGSR